MWDEVKRSFTHGSMLYKLIWLNVGVFLVVFFGGHLLFSFDLIESQEDLLWLASHSDIEKLAERPWTVFTSMFTHNDPGHLIINMLMLWWLGRMYQAELGTRKLLSTYFIGGLVGVLSIVLLTNYTSIFSDATTDFIYGASASVFAIITAMATYQPDRKVPFVLFGMVRLQHLIIAFIVIDYFIKWKEHPEVFVGHFSGALTGFILISQTKKGRNLALPIEWLFDKIATLIPRTGSYTKLRAKKNRGTNSTNKRPKSDDQFNSDRRDDQIKVDAILDKISRHGYDHLTKEEKEFLFKQSKK